MNIYIYIGREDKVGPTRLYGVASFLTRGSSLRAPSIYEIRKLWKYKIRVIELFRLLESYGKKNMCMCCKKKSMRSNIREFL
jgi:hypothetical protein